MVKDAEKCLQAGMNDHITKPVSPERLTQALNKWLLVTNKAASPASEDTVEAHSSGYPVDLVALKHFDALQGIRRIGGKPEAYRKQLRRFRERYPDAVDRLQQLINTRGMLAGEEYCHAIKGVFGALGANALFDDATKIDKLLKERKMPEAEQFEEMLLQLQQAMNEIDGLITSSKELVAAEIMDRDELLAKLSALAILLKSDVSAAEDLLAKLRAGVAGTVMEQALVEMSASMDLFEIDDVLDQVNRLRGDVEAVEPDTRKGASNE